MEIDFDEFLMNTNDNKYDLPEDLIFIEDIDEGAFAKVIHVKEKRTKKDFALKIVNKSESNIDLINRMKEEIQILKKLEHQNIVKYYGQFETSNQLFIKMEYLKYGTLEKWLKENKTISEEKASLIIKEVLSAIAYLHQNQICHRDLKPENIMFSRENDLSSIKIIDFGLSLQNFDNLCNSDYCGTLIYMAPEEIERRSYYLSVDIWSIGILMYMLLNNGEHPFYHEKDTKEIFLKNLKENKKIEFKNKISFMAMHLIKKLLEYDPIKRYKAIDALKHPWITRNPDDKIPQTFNEQLNTYSTFDNAKKLMMISIFLNYFKKNYCTYKKSKIDGGLKNKKCKSTIYRIDDEYIKKCEFFSKKKKDILKKLKGEYLYVKKDIDKSEEKNNNNSNNNTNSTSNHNMSNSGLSNSNINNHHIMKYNNSLFSKNSKLLYHTSKKISLLLVEPNSLRNINNLKTQRIKKKSYFSESKNNNNNNYRINNYNYNESKNKLKIETEAIINKELISHSKKRKSILSRTTTKPFNIRNYHDYNKYNYNANKNIDYINSNIKNIKPINLFLKNKNSIKIKSKNESQKNLVYIPIEKILKENSKENKDKNSYKEFKLPNISYNNIHNMRKTKRKIKTLN